MVLKLNTQDSGPDREREDLVEIDGVMYSIPKEVSPAEGVQYLQDVRQGAHDVALSRLLYRMVGPECVEALAKCQAMTEEDFKTLLGPISTKVGGLMARTTSGN